MHISVHHVETSVRDTSPIHLQGTWASVACCESPLPGNKPQTAAVCWSVDGWIYNDLYCPYRISQWYLYIIQYIIIISIDTSVSSTTHPTDIFLKALVGGICLANHILWLEATLVHSICCHFHLYRIGWAGVARKQNDSLVARPRLEPKWPPRSHLPNHPPDNLTVMQSNSCFIRLLRHFRFFHHPSHRHIFESVGWRYLPCQPHPMVGGNFGS